jgi:predicted nucleic acid-binding protein
MLLDTNIIIELFKGNAAILKSLENKEELFISSVTVMELYFGALNKKELSKIKEALKAFKILHFNELISLKATELVEVYSKSHGLMIPDAIIAATAIVNSTPLATLNLKDFRYIKELKLHSL